MEGIEGQERRKEEVILGDTTVEQQKVVPFREELKEKGTGASS